MKHEITLAELEKSRKKALFIIMTLVLGIVLLVIGGWLAIANVNTDLGIIILIVGAILFVFGLNKVR